MSDNTNPNRPRLLPAGVPRSKAPLTWAQVGPKYAAPDQDPVSVINKMGDEVAYAATTCRECITAPVTPTGTRLEPPQ